MIATTPISRDQQRRYKWIKRRVLPHSEIECGERQSRRIHLSSIAIPTQNILLAE